MDELDSIIRQINEEFGEGTIIPASEAPRPERALEKQAIDDFMERNPMAGGGMLVQPSADGSRPGYKKEKFISGPGTKTTALDDPKKYKIVKKYLNKVKTQKNKRIFLDWSEQIGSKPNPWYVKLSKEVKLTRQPLNELINKVIAEEFPTAYSGRAGKVEYAREMTVKSFINYWNQNGMFDGNEKLSKPLEQFVTTKKGANNYENINRYFTQWKEGKFEVEGVDRKNLDKGLLQAIKKWNPSVKGKRSNLVKEQLIYLNKLSPNLSYDRVANLFAQKFPDSAQTLQHRLNQLTELKRNGVYNDGTGNPKKIPGIEIGERSGWLKEGYGKGFLGNYGRLVKKADELMAAGETKFAKRLYNAADKFFSPTGIFTKAAGEGEHPLSRNMGDGPIGNQLKINSLVSSDLNQFKKFNFDSPVRNLVLEYENPNTTSARKKEIKLEIENRRKLMNILTEGPNQKGIVDSVKFNYGSNKIGASVDVPDIDKIKNFDINEFITRGEEYRKSVLQKGKDVGLIDKKGQIIKQTLGVEQIDNLLLKFAGTITDECAVDLTPKKEGGRIGFKLGSERCLKIAKQGLDNGLMSGFKNKQQVNLAETILRAGGGLKSAFALRNIFGPAAVAATVAFEGGLIGYDMLTSGKTLREAFGDNLLNYALGKDYQINPQEELFKRFKGLGYDDQQIGSIKRSLDAMNTINTGAQLAMDVGQQREALQKSRGQPEEFMIPDDQMMADTAGQRAEQNLKDARNQLAEFNRDFQRSGQADELSRYIESGDYAKGFDLFEQAQKEADIQKLESAGPKFMGSVFPQFEKGRQEDLANLRSVINPAFNIPGARDATFIPGKTVGGLYGLAEGGRAGYKFGKLIKQKPSKVRADAKSIIDENIKLMKQMKETGAIDEISSDLNQVIKKALDEDLFDKKDRIVDSINISEAKKRRNYPYNMQVFEEPKNLDFYTAIQESNFKTKTGPYYDRIRKNKAGGGLLKQAGDRSGAPPESGPNPQGLQGLLNRVKKT